MKKLTGLLLIIFLSAFNSAPKTTRTITGQVLDQFSQQAISGVRVVVKGTDIGTKTDDKGSFSIQLPEGKNILMFSSRQYIDKTITLKKDQTRLVVKLRPPGIIEAESEDSAELNEVVITGYGIQRTKKSLGYAVSSLASERSLGSPAPIHDRYENFNTEEYDVINENTFLSSKSNPLSTISIDVDAASYSNLRRKINQGQIPHKDMVRIEEMINYFQYDYQDPSGTDPFSITMEVSNAPWNKEHKLVHVGIQGQKPSEKKSNPSNLVFLIDVSGSMSASNKLPLLKSSMKLLINELSAEDKISIVTYAGAAGLALPPTSASEKETILQAFDNLSSGGSTAGGQGIKLAYKVAEENFLERGNNRIILATDGDFNIGVSSTSEMVRLIEEKRRSGIYLTITGFGMGNYKDGRMEQISNAGNGNYYYIDNIKEAKKVFVTDMQGTLFTIAKDVKIQVEFNPNQVQAYRLIGYENRKLNAEDFNDDKKDAGELGAGHTVTALYEIIPIGIESSFIKSVDPLKYQSSDSQPKPSQELMTVKIRYKEPTGKKSKLITHTLKDELIPFGNTSDNFRFSAAVTQFGMLLRESKFQQNASFDHTLALAIGAKGQDSHGYRAELIDMIESVQLMKGSKSE